MSSTRLKCFTCNKTFTSDKGLQAHCTVKRHTPALHCPQCDDFIFSDEAAVKEHANKVHRPYKCVDCEGTFCSADALSNHRTAKHDHRCNFCSRQFATPEKLRCHTSQAHNYNCARCGQKYDDRKAYEEHLADPIAHEKLVRAHAWQSLRCCGRAFFDRLAVNQHFRESAQHITEDTAVQVTAALQQPILNRSKEPNYPRLLGPLVTSAILPETKKDPVQSLFPKLSDDSKNPRSAKVSTTIRTFAEPSKNVKTEPIQQAPLPHRSVKTSPTNDDNITFLKPPPGGVNCQFCPSLARRSFLTTKSLEDHQWKEHTTEKLDEERAKIKPPTPLKNQPIQEPLFMCKGCGGNFDTMVLLQEHKERFHSLNCDECFGLPFENGADLMKHWRASHIVPCTNCGERFFRGLIASSSHIYYCLKCELKEKTVSVDLLGLDNGFTTALPFDHDLLSDLSALSSPAHPNATSQQYTDTYTSTTNNSFFSPSNSLPVFSDSSALAPPLMADSSQRSQYSDVSTQTTIHRCDECVEVFDSAAELLSHLRSSPFHGPRVIQCHECSRQFPDQINLLQHIESKPHKTRWVLSLV